MLQISHAGTPSVIALAGEIDESNYAVMIGTVARLADGHPEVHLSLAEVIYCDLAALRAILGLSAVGGRSRGHGGRRLVLRGVPQHLRTVLQILGWDTAPGVSITGPEARHPTGADPQQYSGEVDPAPH